jgi:pilus assembly protein Flp/PilA
MILRESRPNGRRELDARDDRGATAVEYGIMASLIAVVIVASVAFFGQSVKGLFELIVASHPFG